MKKVKKWKQDFNMLGAFNYIHFLNVPMKDSAYGPIIDLPSDTLDILAAEAMIKERIPLRGKELKFLRKIIDHSLEKFANKMGLSSATVFHWEKAENETLAPVNEVAVRTLVAEELNIEMPAKFSLLVGNKVRRIEIKAS